MSRQWNCNETLAYYLPLLYGSTDSPVNMDSAGIFGSVIVVVSVKSFGRSSLVVNIVYILCV